jgi:hypothetical protein
MRSKQRLGQYFALTIVLAVIAVSAFAISRSYATQGLAGMLSSLAVLAAVFVYGNERAIAELRSKWQAVLGRDPSAATCEYSCRVCT